MDDLDIEKYNNWFKYEHLRQDLQDTSKPFCELARKIIANWPLNYQTIMALDHLLIAKDAAVRARL